MNNSYIREQAEKMAARREELAARRAAENTPTTEKRQTDMRPMHERVESVLRQLTPDELNAGIRLEWLCEQIAGKYRGCAQPRQIGAALRRLGFTRKRCWRGGDIGFRSTWHKDIK